MNVLGFGVQTNLFQLIYDNDGANVDFMTDMAIAFSLVGFSVILLTIGRIPFSQIAAWSTIFLITMVRPLGEPLFFTSLSEQNAPQIHHSPCPDAVLTQEECEIATGGAGSDRPTVADRAESRGYPEIIAFTPQLAAINALNRINHGLVNQFLLPGQRLLEGTQGAMEAIRRGRTASESTNFHIRQFLGVCASTGSGAASRLAAAYVPFSQLERQGSTDIIEALNRKSITALDAVWLFSDYFRYTHTQEGNNNSNLLLPSLVCPPGGCDGIGHWSEMDERLPSGDRVSAVLAPLTANSPTDFTRVRDNRLEVHNDYQSLSTRLQRTDIQNINHVLREQNVSVAVPLNANAIAERMTFESAESGSDAGTDLAPIMSGIGTALGAVGGAAIGGAGGCAGSLATAGVIGGGMAATGILAPAAPFVAGAVAILGCAGSIGAGAYFGGVLANSAAPRLLESWDLTVGEGSARTSTPEQVYVVQTCADFHRLTDARLFVDTALSNRLTQTYSQLLQSGRLPPDFSNMNPQQRTMVALHAQLEAQRQRCSERWLKIIRESDDACVERALGNMAELVATVHTASVNNTLPSILASEEVRAGSTPQMIGDIRNLMIGVGDVFAPVGVSIKALWGGFEAGTYAAIMPFIVSFGTALVIMITPFLYIIGLLVPMWALSIFLIPIVGVLYFQLVKTVFVIINIMSSTMIDAHGQGLLTTRNAEFSDIILGTAYTMAFILSAGLLFALRNPAAIIQNVAGKADGLSQISWQQAVAAAYIGQKGVGMVGNALSGQRWGQISSGVQNTIAGRGGWHDQFKTAEFEGLRKADDMRLTAEQAKLTPAESNESLAYRGNARAIDDINKRADEADKGSLMSGQLRKGRRFAYRDNRGNQRFVDLDAANIALAEVLDKSAPEISHGREMSRKMLNQKIVVVSELSDGRNVLQVDRRRLQQTSDASIHKYIDRLRQKGHLGSVEDSDTGKTFNDVLVNVKI